MAKAFTKIKETVGNAKDRVVEFVHDYKTEIGIAAWMLVIAAGAAFDGYAFGIMKGRKVESAYVNKCMTNGIPYVGLDKNGKEFWISAPDEDGNVEEHI